MFGCNDIIYIEITQDTVLKTEIGKRHPELAKRIAIDLCLSKTIDTKVNYASLLRSWWAFNIEHGFDPFKPRIDPQVAIFWMFDRTYRLGSCNSHKMWGGALSWWVIAHNMKPVYYENQFYINLKKAMLKRYLRSRKVRLPIEIQWIVVWIKKLNVTPENWYTVDLDSLTKVVLLLFIYFTLSRPNELLFTDKTENVNWEIKTTGLKWCDFKFDESSHDEDEWFLQLKVKWFKNQVYHGEPKIVFMGKPTCGDLNCKCVLLDFYSMIKVLHLRRTQLWDKLKLQKGTKKCTKTWWKRYNNLGTHSNNYVFVGKNGAIWRPSILRSMVKNLISVNNVSDPECFVPYSLRIGATTLAHMQQIDLLKVMRYVVWSVNNLPHVSGRYIMFTHLDLCTIPFEMIHGGNVIGKKNVDRSGGKWNATNIWSNKVANKMFSQTLL